jgi:hypothetical protein
MDEKPASLKDEFKHLFKTPTDAMFAIMPYAFWEIMALEINHFASHYMDKSKKNIATLLARNGSPFQWAK